MSGSIRRVVIVLGDQLDRSSSVFDGFEVTRDVVVMAEVAAASRQPLSAKARTVFFLSAMRHFASALRDEGVRVEYTDLSAAETGSLAEVLGRMVRGLGGEEVRVVEPGCWHLRHALAEALSGTAFYGFDEDRHFFCSRERFDRHCAGRKQLRMEFFYREMRREHGVLMAGKGPEGGEWNYDAENRASFGREGPGFLPRVMRFPADAVTVAVVREVEQFLPELPGSAAEFDFPVTRAEALVALEDFVTNRLADFGRWQDAMWVGEEVLYHARLSAAMNVKLLSPREVVARVERAYREGLAPLAATEGFIRQVLGWREYVRGVYWRHMPGYLEGNALEAKAPLPAFFWTGETDMACLRDAIGQTLRTGYAHHIQRLMVTGLYALLHGVNPREVHEWYLAVYVDAVEWVEIPNVIGMSQYADGGVMASKPYAATGKYLKRMSNACSGCRYDPEVEEGERACPFTRAYWEFLEQNRERLAGNQRMAMQLRNLARRGVKGS